MLCFFFFSKIDLYRCISVDFRVNAASALVVFDAAVPATFDLSVSILMRLNLLLRKPVQAKQLLKSLQTS